MREQRQALRVGVRQTRRDVEDRAEQLKGISNLAALHA